MGIYKGVRQEAKKKEGQTRGEINRGGGGAKYFPVAPDLDTSLDNVKPLCLNLKISKRRKREEKRNADSILLEYRFPN